MTFLATPSRAALLLWGMLLVAAPALAQAPSSPCGETAPDLPYRALVQPPDTPAQARALSTRPKALTDLLHRRDEVAREVRDRDVWAVPSAPCVGGNAVVRRAGDQPLLESTLTQLYVEGEWNNFGRSFRTYDAVDSLVAHQTQYWENGEWHDDWLEDWTYESGRLVQYAFTSIFFGVPDGWRETFTYDAEGRLEETLYEIYSGNGWVNNARYTFTYGEDGLLDLLVEDLWNGADWVPNYRETSGHDAEGRLLTAETQWYDPISEAWTPNTRYTWAYAPGEVTELSERWDGMAWQNDYHATLTMDTADRLVEVVALTWQDGVWMNNMWLNNTYLDATGPLLTEQVVRWGEGSGERGGGEWVDGWHVTYEYDSAQRLTAYTYLRGVGATEWVNQARRTYTYDGDSLVEEFEEIGDGGDGWVNNHLLNFFNDPEGLPFEILSSEWVDSEWSMYARTLLEYASPSAGEDGAAVAALSLDVFPNPASEVTIALDLDRGATTTLEVIDLLGRRVARLIDGEAPAGPRRLTWRPDGLAPGLYYVRLRAGSQTVVRAVTVVR